MMYVDVICMFEAVGIWKPILVIWYELKLFCIIVLHVLPGLSFLVMPNPTSSLKRLLSAQQPLK